MRLLMRCKLMQRLSWLLRLVLLLMMKGIMVDVLLMLLLQTCQPMPSVTAATTWLTWRRCRTQAKVLTGKPHRLRRCSPRGRITGCGVWHSKSTLHNPTLSCARGPPPLQRLAHHHLPPSKQGRLMHLKVRLSRRQRLQLRWQMSRQAAAGVKHGPAVEGHLWQRQRWLSNPLALLVPRRPGANNAGKSNGGRCHCKGLPLRQLQVSSEQRPLWGQRLPQALGGGRAHAGVNLAMFRPRGHCSAPHRRRLTPSDRRCHRALQQVAVQQVNAPTAAHTQAGRRP